MQEEINALNKSEKIKKLIEAHFLTCFTSLVMLRLLQSRLKDKYSIDKIIKSLQKYGCVNLESNKYAFTYHDEIIKEFSEAFNLSLDRNYRSCRELRSLSKYLKIFQ